MAPAFDVFISVFEWVLSGLSLVAVWLVGKVRELTQTVKRVEEQNVVETVPRIAERLDALEETMSQHETRLKAVEANTDKVHELTRYMKGDDADPAQPGVLETLARLQETLDDLETNRVDDKGDINDRLDALQRRLDDLED